MWKEDSKQSKFKSIIPDVEIRLRKEKYWMLTSIKWRIECRRP